MEPEDQLQYTKKPTRSPYSEPGESSPQLPILFL